MQTLCLTSQASGPAVGEQPGRRRRKWGCRRPGTGVLGWRLQRIREHCQSLDLNSAQYPACRPHEIVQQQQGWAAGRAGLVMAAQVAWRTCPLFGALQCPAAIGLLRSLSQEMIMLCLQAPGASAPAAGGGNSAGGADDGSADVLAEVSFDGGFSVPGSIYNRLFDYQKTGMHSHWQRFCDCWIHASIASVCSKGMLADSAPWTVHIHVNMQLRHLCSLSFEHSAQRMMSVLVDIVQQDPLC